MGTRITWSVGVTMTLLLTLGPGQALAQRAGGMAVHGGVHHGGAAPGFHHPGFHRPLGGRGPIIVYAPPLWYGGVDPYYSAAGYDLSSAYAPSAYPPAGYGGSYGGTIALSTPPPMPSVVEYPTGRFELRGDGVVVPYRWVWIPNPPLAPPPPAPPAGPPAAPQAPPASREPEPTGRTTVYRWTDAQGVLHLTDRLDQVPEKYRSQANRTRSS